MKTKVCTKCGRELPLSEFGKHRLTKDGLAYRCKECGRKHAREWNDTPSGVFSRARGRNNYYQNKPFTITKEDFIQWYVSQPRECTYCGIKEHELTLVKDCYNNKNKRLSVDCKNNKLGYVKGNLVLACYRCNSIKSNILTFDEMMYIGQNFIKPKWKFQLQNTRDT